MWVILILLLLVSVVLVHTTHKYNALRHEVRRSFYEILFCGTKAWTGDQRYAKAREIASSLIGKITNNKL